MSSIHEFEDADFLVRSWLDGSTFAVNRAKLEAGSHVFRAASEHSNLRARQVLLASVVYLPLLYGLLVIDGTRY